jgi:hypothetical protein
MHHPVSRQVLDGYQISLIDDAATALMCEVAPPPACTFMDARHYPPAKRALKRSFFHFDESALRLGKRLLLRTEEARVGDLLSRAKRREGSQPSVYTHLLPSGWQRRRFGALAGKADVPLAGATPSDGRGLRRPLQRAMQEDLDQSDNGDADALVLSIKATTDWNLREGNAVISTCATTARLARRLAPLHATKEGLERRVKSDSDILQHLRVRACQRGSFAPEGRQDRLLVVQACCRLPLLPSRLALGEELIIQPAARFKLLIEEALLWCGRIQAVRERLTHNVTTA